jgi:hypothetical protein
MAVDASLVLKVYQVDIPSLSPRVYIFYSHDCPTQPTQQLVESVGTGAKILFIIICCTDHAYQMPPASDPPVHDQTRPRAVYRSDEV